MAKELANSKVTRSFYHNVPAYNGKVYQPGDSVYVWRETPNDSRSRELTEPHKVQIVHERSRIIAVKNSDNNNPQQFSLNEVNQHREPKCDTTFMHVLHTTLLPYITLYIGNSDIRVTEVVSKNDPRADSTRILEAARIYARDMMKRRAFRVMLDHELPDDAKTLTCRFVLAIKYTADGTTRYKVRHIIGGHRNHLKHYLVHFARTLRPMYRKLLLTIESLYKFEV